MSTIEFAADAVLTQTKQYRCRTVITTDGEVDDQDSVIRALLYANEMDLAGIVLTSSMYHYAGDGDTIEPYRWTGTQWLSDFIDAYEEVYPNLCVHAKGYPAPDFLRTHTKIGNIKNKGEMEEVTEGSEFLKKLFLDDDPRTLYVQTWGGTNTTARALKSIEEEYSGKADWKDVQQKIYDKLVIYIILDQDESYSNYIAKSWPDLKVLNDSCNFWHFAYAWQFHADELNSTLHADWQQKNIVGDHGPLMALYALMGDGKTVEGELDEEQRGWDSYLAANPNYKKYDFISEGDSPSFFYLLDTGLRSLEDPTWGGWGGRFDKDGKNTVADYNPYSKKFESSYTLTRWFDDINNDFAARVDWCTATKFEDANHAPSLSVTEGIDLTAAAGDKVTLTAVGEDPDGDKLSYRWWRYFEADTYKDGFEDTKLVDDDSLGLLIDRTAEVKDGDKLDKITLEGADTDKVTFTVPEDAKAGDTIHMIAEVSDDGAHTLKHYQRVVITVA
ncbi:MAG: DUF1593 domain-containing protein [Coriobacteriales bacterium]|nr:DUF1593 domain-containing protein [Coriobacteriales bacterium]